MDRVDRLLSTALLNDLTPFFGRERERAEIARLIADPNCRLLTLAGPGGMGKTRLAQAAAQERASAHTDGAVFVALEAVTTPDQILPAIAGAIGLRLNSAEDPLEQLQCCLRDMDALFVLDNFEQVLDGAEIVSRLLREGPDLKIVVTSRERLRLVEEWVFDVGGLDVPAEDICENYADFSALQLFTSAARRVQPQFSLDDECTSVVHICRLLDGMPLAIELAASWVRVLTAGEIAAELARGLDILQTPARNMPPQHRQMRAVFDHSWRLLTEREQAVFARLSVFAGGFQAEAAEAVAGATRLDLASLLDKSWLRRAADSSRFTIHELARQYGLERLLAREGTDSVARDQHAAYFARYLDQQWPGLMSADYKAACRAIERELDNVRAAWLHAVGTRDTLSLHRGLRSLWMFFDSGSRFREGEGLFAAAVAEVRHAVPEHEALLGRLLARQGALIFSLDHYPRAEAILRESLTLLERHDLVEDIAFAELELGMTLSFGDQASLDAAIALTDSAVTRYRALGHDFGIAYALYWLSLLQANARYIARQPGADVLSIAMANLNEAEAIFKALGHPWGIASVQIMFSAAAALRKDFRLAYEIARSSRDGFDDLGVIWGVSQGLRMMCSAALQLGWDDEARRLILEELRLNLRYGLWNHALGLAQNMARWMMAHGQDERAAELLGATETERIRLGRGRDSWAHPLLDTLDSEPSPRLAAAIERGKARKFEPFLRELLAGFELEAAPPAHPASTQANDTLADPLTQRELEILQLVASGRSNREIARDLFLSVGTVKAHVHNLTGKLGAANRTEAAALGRRLGLLTDHAE